MSHTLQKTPIGGKALTDYLSQMILQNNPHLKPSTSAKVIQEIKETYCYLPSNSDEENSQISKQQRDLELPDSTVIRISDERVRCPEILFDPSEYDILAKPIQDVIVDCISHMERDLMKELYNNIYITGGNTLVEGFPERLTKQLEEIAGEGNKVQVIAPLERKYSNWIGGSILTCLSSFNESWITCEEFKEEGNSLIHRREVLF